MALVGQQLLEAANTAVQDACKRPVKLSQSIFFTLNAQLFTAMMMVQILILLLMLDARHCFWLPAGRVNVSTKAATLYDSLLRFEPIASRSVELYLVEGNPAKLIAKKQHEQRQVEHQRQHSPRQGLLRGRPRVLFILYDRAADA